MIVDPIARPTADNAIGRFFPTGGVFVGDHEVLFRARAAGTALDQHVANPAAGERIAQDYSALQTVHLVVFDRNQDLGLQHEPSMPVAHLDDDPFRALGDALAAQIIE